MANESLQPESQQPVPQQGIEDLLTAHNNTQSTPVPPAPVATPVITPPHIPVSVPGASTSGAEISIQQQGVDDSRELAPSIIDRIREFFGNTSTLERLAMLAGMLFIVAVIVIGTIYWLQRSEVPEGSTVTNTGDQTPNVNVQGVFDPAVQANRGIADSDGDGLLDEEEGRLRTDGNKIDTDDDGLTDRQEVQVYKTNPLNKDTDGDRFSDGEEVRNFYNPNGSGTLSTTNNNTNQ